jgi:hypothetical protein
MEAWNNLSSSKETIYREISLFMQVISVNTANKRDFMLSLMN